MAHSPPFHWVACLVDFENKLVRFGNGLRRPPPAEFINGLSEWLQEGFGFAFTVLEDLQCGMQNDMYSCPIISVNAIQHHIFGDALWTPETARSLRMKAFLELVQEQNSTVSNLLLLEN